MSANNAQLEKLKKVREAINSHHVSTVEVGFEYEMDDIRYYTAVTYKNGEAHRYSVRVQDVFEAGEKQTFGKCSCAAGSKNMVCRHLLKVAKIDSEKFNRDLYVEGIANYNAHRNYRSAA
jgi:hypothetical protein